MIQVQPLLLEQYVWRLNQHQQDILAEQIIVSSLQQEWNERLVQIFSLLKLDNVEQRIKLAQQWFIEHKDSPSLLLTLGRLHKQKKHWGQAKNYLESSLSQQPLVETYAELADLHEHLNEIADARRCAKKGLHLATDH
jgi:HemY protein